MTWNVENLFLPGAPSGPESEEVWQRKLTTLATTISAIAPDVLALQEIGSPEAFDQLQVRVAADYPHGRLSSAPDSRGIRVGFLSKYPLQDAVDYVYFPAGALDEVPGPTGAPLTRLGRGALKVTVRPAADLPVNLVTTHLKSKLVTYANGRRWPRDESERARGSGLALLTRTAEAVALRISLNELMIGNRRPLVLLGDLNDGPDAVTTQILQGPADRSLARPDRLDDVRLYNLAGYIAPDRRFSRIYQQQAELIDHIAVSHELVFHQRRVDSFIEPIRSIDQSVETRRDEVFPDHAPVFATFELPTA
jgi:endonuclease/exonuclease/phosphatase family metal-dependent hydrolase